jgi:hypothetical protein
MLTFKPVYLFVALALILSSYVIPNHFSQNNFSNTLNENVIFVNATATGMATGEDWQNAFNKLSDALLIAQEGDSIWIAQGVYYPTATNDRNATFAVTKNIAIFGGFSGAEVTFHERNPEQFPTILSGNIGATEDSLDNSFHILTAIDTDTTALIDGITIQEGFNENEYGSAIHLKKQEQAHAHIKINNCKVTGNTGGAVLIDEDTKAYFSNSQISYNINGGIQDLGIGADFLNCRFEYNNNQTGDGGAYISNWIDDWTTFTNCIFNKNYADGKGSAIYNFDKAVVNNCVFWGHSGEATIYVQADGDMLIVNNSIFWSNSRNVKKSFNPYIELNRCLLKDQFQGYTGMILNDPIWNRIPVFNDPYNGDFTLSPCSPAIDSGITDSLSADVIVDFEGNPRVAGAAVDLGAIERQNVEPCQIFVTDTIDNGLGSLQRAVEIANAHYGADTVKFDMKNGDPPYVFSYPNAIQLKEDSTVIDATTQPGWEPGAIQLDGSSFDFCYVQDSSGTFIIIICEYVNYGSYPGYAFVMKGDHCALNGMYFTGHSRHAVVVEGDYSTIGSPEKGNIFAFNSREGLNLGDILVRGENTTIQANIFGQTPDGEYGGERGAIQIFTLIMEDGPGGKLMVGGDRENGEGNQFFNRNIALHTGSSADNIPAPSLGQGSYFKGNDFYDFQNGPHLNTTFSLFNIAPNTEFEDLTIEDNRFHQCSDIFWVPLDSTGRLEEVVLSNNQFTCNSDIYNYNNPDASLDTMSRINQFIFPDLISGISRPYDTIEVFIHNNLNCPDNEICQGAVYLGTAVADQNQAWYLEDFAHPVVPGDLITAIARDTDGNSTLFMDCQSVRCPLSISIDTTLCFGETFTYNGVDYDQAGFYETSDITYDTCITPVFINLSILPESDSLLFAEICEPEEFTWNGQVYDQSGMYTQVFTNVQGCDSVVTVDLTVLPLDFTIISEMICEGDSYIWNGESYEEGGTYSQSFPNQYGCDSTVTLELTVLPEVQTVLDTALMIDVPYNGNYYSQDTTLLETYLDVNGCDSTVITNINVITSGISNKSLSRLSLEVYPNPFDEFTTFQIEGVEVKSGRLLIFDAIGNLVKSEVFKGSTIELSRVHLPAQVYFYKLQINEYYMFNGSLVVQ